MAVGQTGELNTELTDGWMNTTLWQVYASDLSCRNEVSHADFCTAKVTDKKAHLDDTSFLVAQIQQHSPLLAAAGDRHPAVHRNPSRQQSGHDSNWLKQHYAAKQRTAMCVSGQLSAFCQPQHKRWKLRGRFL